MSSRKITRTEIITKIKKKNFENVVTHWPRDVLWLAAITHTRYSTASFADLFFILRANQTFI